jgi:hypothetical protein
MKEIKMPTIEQARIAKKFHIPMDQAHTVNLKKAKAYQEYLVSDRGRLEKYFDAVDEARGYAISRGIR